MNGRTVPIEDQIAEVEREIALRRSSYGRRVASGAMPRAYADQRIAVMEAVRETLRRRDNEIGKHADHSVAAHQKNFQPATETTT